MAAQRLVEFRQSGTVTVATFTRDEIFEEEEIQVVGEELLRQIEATHPPRFVLNFFTVIRMSSHMLGELMAIHKRTNAAGGRLALCGLRQQLRDIFTFLKLDQIFPIYDSEDEAVRSFA
jgi:anti-sigma B factor antagonist